MNKTRVIALLLALGVAGGAAVLLNGMMVQNNKPRKVVTKEKVERLEVLIVAKNIERGRQIGSDDLKWAPWPRNMVSGTMVTKEAFPGAISQYAGHRALANLFAGEPFTPAKVLSSNGGYLASKLPKGMRAIAVSINLATLAGGFIMPNDRVDVLLTRKISGRTVTDTVLSNVKVLAIDQQSRVRKDKKSEDAVAHVKTATLELEPRQAEVLAKAASMGQLSLVLRSLADAGDSELGDAGPRLSPKYAGRNGGEIKILRYGVPHTLADN